jgi:RHS repeat-associated protein
MASFGADSITWDLRGRPVATSIGGESLEFVYFGGRLPNDPQSGALLPLDLGVASVDFDAAGRSYRHFDFRHNVSFVSDESGAIVSHYQYSAYGLDTVFGSDEDAVRFVGRQQIGELMWLGARIYDPIVGRFLSPDPVFSLINQFTYTLGNPIRYWDPDGRYHLLSPTVEGGVVGAALFAGYAASQGCFYCGVLSLFLSVVLLLNYFGKISHGARSGPPGPGGFGGGLGGGIGGSVPSCGLLGIEPFFVLLFLRRRRRRPRPVIAK